MIYRADVREGMTVRSSDGEKLGKVRAIQDDGLLIEKGWFFPKEYFVAFEDVSAKREDELVLTRSRDELVELGRAHGETRGVRSKAAAEEVEVEVEVEKRPVVREELRETVVVSKQPVVEQRAASGTVERETAETEEERERRRREREEQDKYHT